MKKQYIIGASILALVISFIVDKKILSPVYSIRFSFLTAVMKVITSKWAVVTVIIIASVILYKKRRFILLWISCINTFIITLLLKLIIPTTRPSIAPLINITTPSLPSMHTGILFAIIPIINKYKPKLRYILLIIVILITFSRLYLGIHYLSDLIAGALIGYILGLVIIWLSQKYKFIK